MAAKAGMVAAERNMVPSIVAALHLELACRLLDPLDRGELVTLRAVANRWRAAPPELVLLTSNDRHLVDAAIDELMPGWLSS